ncbi:hypothetical protein NUW54_g1372 [Trametes sanguinea]|uniref:Uncharacterized protein n=1 Tax=Trametes sanguinea TaxID=158606 RepID=A0ACC1Q7V1_9APHY|nr:hypothetical protein NUW54_g1372 [Trametes sanguinea]
MASASATGKLSREEFRRQKDLDAARKAGTAPAALDEEGKPINPHIPQYIAPSTMVSQTSLGHAPGKNGETGWPRVSSQDEEAMVMQGMMVVERQEREGGEGGEEEGESGTRLRLKQHFES